MPHQKISNLTFLQTLKALRERADVVLRYRADDAIPEAVFNNWVWKKLVHKVLALLLSFWLHVLESWGVDFAVNLLELDF